jgi:PadR family transcriptional regulator, regulatory protein PadR
MASMAELKILSALLENPTGEHYGYDLIKTTSLLSGTLYPILARLENDGVLVSEVEDVDAREVGRRPRRYYRLTGAGVRYASNELNKLQKLIPVARTA